MGDRRILKGGVVFDGTGAAPARIDVAIEGELIVALGHHLEGDDRVDLAGAALFPGFIDCHSHVAMRSIDTFEQGLAKTPSRIAFAAIANLRATLAGGVTTVRDAAFADAGYREAIEAGDVLGPRLLVSLVQLSPSAGPYDLRTKSGHDAWIQRQGLPLPVADGPDGVRAKVREAVALGADVIKIFATGPSSMARGGAHRTLFTDEELAAVVDEAARQGVKVMAHAHGARGGEAAARAGVASIEHGLFLDDAALDAMATRRTTLVPTLLASEADSDRAEAHRDVVRKAKAKGVAIAMGTDCPIAPHGSNLRELELLTASGLTPTEALVAATSSAARLLGLENEIGRIAPGLQADLIVVDGDPLDVSALPDRVREVYQRGRRVIPDAVAGGQAVLGSPARSA